MAVKIKDFISKMNKFEGPARPSHFVVELALPQSVSATGSQNISLFCEAASLPGITVTTDDRNAPYGYGAIQKMPWNVLFTDIYLTFIGDNQGQIHHLLTKWVDSIVLYNTVSPVSVSSAGQPFFVNYRSNYATDIIIRMYDPRLKSIIEYTLHDAFPSSIYDSTLNWGDAGYMRFQTRISFTRWTVKYEKLGKTSSKLLAGLNDEINKTINGLISKGGAMLGINNANLPTYNFDLTDAVNSIRGDLVNRAQTKITSALVDSYSKAIPLLGGLADFRI